MVTNYYNASNNFSAPIRREPKPFRPCDECEPKMQKKETVKHSQEMPDRDTMLIVGLILLLLITGCDDTLLLLALLYIVLF